MVWYEHTCGHHHPTTNNSMHVLTYVIITWHALKHTNKRSLILVFPEQNHAKFQLPNAPSKYKSPYGNILFSA